MNRTSNTLFNSISTIIGRIVVVAALCTLIATSLWVLPRADAAILNTHPGATAAYSLRKLDSTYAGSAIRVRRSFDNTERDIGFASNGNLDTTTLQSFVPAGTPTVSGNWNFLSAVNAGNLVGGTVDRSELSGLAALLKSGNDGMFIGVHDSNTGRAFVFNRFGESKGDIILTGATMTDAEEVSTYTTGGVAKVVVGAFGDNAGNRATKQLFRFNEPTITGSNITLPNDGSWEQIDFVYPASPLWENGTNMGDVEAMFVDAVGDNKIYFITKRETVNKIFSLPLQSSYSGTQTLTYEGEVHTSVAEETGGIISPANAVAAAISQDGLHVLVKTYNKIYQFTRSSTSTSIPALLATAPVQVPYVGLGAHPNAEPQGEAVAFDKNDSGYYTISETGTGSTATNFPLFYFRKVPTYASSTVVVQEGLNGYNGTQDTYVNQGANEGTNYGAATSIISDKNISDERFGMLKWTNLDLLVPDGAQILTATIGFYISTEGQGFDVHKIIGKSWSESTVTWTNLGGMSLNDIDASANKVARWPGVDTYVGPITLDLDPAVVQDWVDNPLNNNGLWIVGTHADDGQQITSSEGLTQSARPKLTITYYINGTGYVTKWYDQSGNNNDLTQTSTTTQPKIVSGGSVITRNSKPAIQFEGNAYVEKTAASSPFGSTEGHHFIVSIFDDTADTSQAIYDISTSTTQTNSWANLGMRSGGLEAYAALSPSGIDSISDVSFTDTTVNVYNHLVGSTHRFIWDEAEIGQNTISLTPNTASNLRLGQLFGASTFGLIGAIQEAVFYTSDKTSVQDAVEDNMNDYWVTAVPPSRVDLNGADISGGAVNATATVGADTVVALSTDVLRPAESDIASIKVVINGITDGASEKLILDGSTPESLHADFSASNSTVGSVSGISYVYTVSNHTLLITKTNSSVITGSQIEAIIEAMQYKNTQTTNTNDGARVFTFTYIDSGANESAGDTTSTITVTRSSTNTVSTQAVQIVPGSQTMVSSGTYSQAELNTIFGRGVSQQVQASTQGSSVSLSGVVSIKNTYIPNSRGVEVISIQKILNLDPQTRIAVSGPGAPGKETNLYGPATKRAIQKFQLKYGIVTSTKDSGYGIFGPKTKAKINEILKQVTK